MFRTQGRLFKCSQRRFRLLSHCDWAFTWILDSWCSARLGLMSGCPLSVTKPWGSFLNWVFDYGVQPCVYLSWGLWYIVVEVVLWLLLSEIELLGKCGHRWFIYIHGRHSCFNLMMLLLSHWVLPRWHDCFPPGLVHDILDKVVAEDNQSLKHLVRGLVQQLVIGGFLWEIQVSQTLQCLDLLLGDQHPTL